MILFLMDKFLMREELSHWQVELANIHESPGTLFDA